MVELKVRKFGNSLGVVLPQGGHPSLYAPKTVSDFT